MQSASPEQDRPDGQDEQGNPALGSLRRPRTARRSATALIGVLVAALGFAIAVQVHAHSQSDSLANLREDDLISILDNQDARADRLRQQIADLQAKLASLRDSRNGAAAARQQAEQDAQTLGILLGTLPATGSGVEVDITDPGGVLKPEQLLDVVEELRGAGAEAIQFGPIRIGANSAFTAVDGALAVDGTVLAPPYQVLAIGDAKTLDTALNIPGGVAAALRTVGADLAVSERASLTVTAVREIPAASYATPAH